MGGGSVPSTVPAAPGRTEGFILICDVYQTVSQILHTLYLEKRFRHIHDLKG